VILPNGSEHGGVANLGKRPMFEPEELLEAHLFDYSGDLYGRPIEVSLHHYLRPEAKFDTIDQLIVPIAADAEEARRPLGQRVATPAPPAKARRNVRRARQ